MAPFTRLGLVVLGSGLVLAGGVGACSGDDGALVSSSSGGTGDGGIVIEKETMMAAGSTTLPHEMGHFFGLLHTFEGSGIELVDARGATRIAELIERSRL